MTDLTPKQRAFVEAYLKNGRNASDAYRRAYDTKASDAVIAVNACKLLSNAKVALIVAEADRRATAATERVLDRYEVTQERIITELAKIGFANMLDYMSVGSDGDPVLDFSAIDRDQAAALTEVTVEDFKDGRGAEARDVRKVKFKLADKRAALVDLGKHMGMFIDRKEVGKPGAFDKMTPEQKRERAISLAKQLGIERVRPRLDS